MARRATAITLTDSDRDVLTGRLRAAMTPRRDWQRAAIVLTAADGATNVQIAADLGLDPDTVCTWRVRFAREGLAGLADRRRTGRPPRFTPVQVAEVKALACTRPADLDLPLEHWSNAELAAHATREGIVPAVSASSVGRWLEKDAIRPWRHRSWIFPRDPDFVAKASRALDLYARIFEGEPLGDDDYVLSTDEKSQLQALRRCHPTAPARPRPSGRVRVRAWWHPGVLRGLRCAPSQGHGPDRADHRDRPVQPARHPGHDAGALPSARQVFWIADNGSSHRGQASINRMSAAYANATLVHLPVHASWLNQVVRHEVA